MLMKRLVLTVTFLWSLLAGSPASAHSQVEFITNYGNFVIEVYADKAPKTVANFLEYVHDGFYHEVLFHRVIDRFIVQAGSFRPDMSQKRSYDPIANESDNGLKNERGTVAMARGFQPDSATSEFFINLNNNKTLNYYNQEPGLRGYCVFGRVIRGMEVLDRIAQVPTRVDGKLTDLPVQQVLIQKAEVLTTPIVAEQPSKAAATEPAKGKTAKPSRNSKTGKKGKKRG